MQSNRPKLLQSNYYNRRHISQSVLLWMDLLARSNYTVNNKKLMKCLAFPRYPQNLILNLKRATFFSDICCKFVTETDTSILKLYPFNQSSNNFHTDSWYTRGSKCSSPDPLLLLCKDMKQEGFYVKTYLNAVLFSSSSTNQEVLEFILNCEIKQATWKQQCCQCDVLQLWL